MILTHTSDHITTITLNRPEKLNALSNELQEELNEALWEADADTRVHAVIIRGNGRSIPAGCNSFASGARTLSRR